jgi:hypothetical protein
MDWMPAEQRLRWSAVATDVVDDQRLRWSAVAAAVVVWLALAWADVTFLLLLLAPGAVVWLARRYPHEPREVDDLF